MAARTWGGRRVERGEVVRVAKAFVLGVLLASLLERFAARKDSDVSKRA